jgi:hypothetical protein
MARSRRTPAMLPGRCSLELSDRKLHRKIKSHKLRAKPSDCLNCQATGGAPLDVEAEDSVPFLSPWTGAPCLRRRSRGTTWVEHDGAKPLPKLPFACSEVKQREEPSHLASRTMRSRPVPPRPGLPWRDLRCRGPFLGMRSLCSAAV